MRTQNEIAMREEDSDEVNLMQVWQVALKYKLQILKIVLVAATLAAGISLLIPNVYRAEILLAPASTDGLAGKKSGLASALGSMGGLGALAGLSLGGSVDENVAVLQSRAFLWQFVQKNNLMPILFEDDWDADKKRWKADDVKDQPNQWDVYRLFIKNGKLDVSIDKKTSLVTVDLDWTDAALAAKWANDLIAQLNQYLARQSIERSERNLKYLNEELARTQVEEMRQALFDMIASEQKNAMTANTQKEFAFKVLDPAAEPDRKIKPKRSLIVILIAMLAGMMATGWFWIKETARDSKG